MQRSRELSVLAAAAILLSGFANPDGLAVSGGSGISGRLHAADTLPELTQREADEIAVEAYVYFYSLVTMDVSRRQFTNVAAGQRVGRGPMNTFSHLRAFPPADFREVVRPNFDTLYSSAWLDLTVEPMIVSAPDTQGRYYLLPMLDMWTDVFACPGKRTTGTEAGHFGVVPPGWQGELPQGVVRIEAPTPYVWIIGRTQTNGPKDYEEVHKVQDGFRITPLSRWERDPLPITVQVDPTVDMQTPALEQVNGMPAAKYFSYAAKLLKTHPPHITDQPILARMQRLGLRVGQDFQPEQASPIVQRALEQASARGLKAMQTRLPTLARSFNGWQMNTDTMGVYGNNYLKRAIIAMAGLGANLPEDAIYPLGQVDREGRALNGANQYVLRFKAAELPPVEAFWSVTMYDNAGFAVANPIQRQAIGDRDALKYNADGSLDLYIQRESPGADRESNWLPAPAGPFNLTMRLYAPRAEALNGEWVPPAVDRAK